MGVFDKLRGLLGRRQSKSKHGNDSNRSTNTVLSGNPGADLDLPPVEVVLDLRDIKAGAIASHSGPEGGINILRACAPGLQLQWDSPTSWAYGSSISMYDASPVTGRRSGEPIADCYVVLGYGNGALLLVADGVNWGEPARRAARCAVLGATAHMHTALERLAQQGGMGRSSSEAKGTKDAGAAGVVSGESTQVRPISPKASSTSAATPGSPNEPIVATSHVLFRELFGAVEAAQKLIKQQCGTMTTLVLTLVLPAREVPDALASAVQPQESTEGTSCSNLLKVRRSMSRGGKAEGSGGSASVGTCAPLQQWAALTLTVGDSPAYVWRAGDGCVQELTAACHAGAVRDPRWTPGALGYALGDDPDLANMTASITLLSEGDIVFLTSDGVADNFDPVIMKTARRAPYASELMAAADAAAEPDGPPVMTQDELEAAALTGLGRAIASVSGAAPDAMSPGKAGQGGASQAAPPLSAQQLADGLLRHVYAATEETRRFTEQRAAQVVAAAEAAKAANSTERCLSTDGPRRTSISNIAVSLPGKMDHATVAAYQVGRRPAAA